MTPLDFPLLTDENIAPDVVAGLRARGLDLRTVRDEQLIGRPDVEVSFAGIIYLRPGHISTGFVLEIVDALRASTVDVVPPFIAVAERQQTTVRVRVRTAPPW